MIRERFLDELRRRYGEPDRNPSSEWWTIGSRTPFPVHVCLNQPTRLDEAHVLIYDPRRTEGMLVVDVRASSSAEVDGLCGRIEAIVAKNGTPSAGR